MNIDEIRRLGEQWAERSLAADGPLPQRAVRNIRILVRNNTPRPRERAS